MPGELIEIRKRALEKHRSNLVSFVKEPRGVFEWIDTSIKIFREANKESIEAIRGKVGTKTTATAHISGYSIRTSELIEKIKEKLGLR